MKYAKEAEENIVCYKIVERSVDLNTFVYKSVAYKSVWYDFIYKIGSRYHERSFSACSTEGTTSHEVSCGFHSYATLRVPAIRFSEGWYSDNYVVLKCIIPKGTLYFVSDDFHTEYCSQDIMVISELRCNIKNNEVAEVTWDEWPKNNELEFT
jgi:hypothetical protein